MPGAPPCTWHCTSSVAAAIDRPRMRAWSVARVVAAGAPTGGRIGLEETFPFSCWNTAHRKVKSTAPAHTIRTAVLQLFAVVAVLVVNRDPPPDLAAITGRLQGRVARFKLPKAVVVKADLPRNAMGKVRKEALRAEFGGMFTTRNTG